MRLIDANALRETVITDYYEHYTQCHDTDQIALIDMVCDGIDEATTVDAEIRVRCENCVSSGGDRLGELICQNQLCPCYGREVDHAFSCILGERKD